MSKESSLRASFWDGVYASVMFGVTGNYVTPFALLIGATAYEVGLLNSLPLLFGAVIQLFSEQISRQFKDRVKSIAFFVLLQAASWIVVCSIIFLPAHARFGFFIVIVVFNVVFGSVATPAWASLMSDTVEANKYGEYFSWRGKVMGFVNLLSSFAAGIFLYLFPYKIYGFLIIFLVAGISGVLSRMHLLKMDDVKYEEKREKEFTYYQFVKRFAESNFVKFVFFVSLLNFGVFLASPFFAVYMIKELNFSYLSYTLVTVSAALAGLITLPFWGRLSDRYGNAKVIKATAAITTILPILWLLTKSPLLLSIINALAGYVWAGFNLAIINFIFDATSKEVRARCFAYFSFTNGVFIFAGTLLGGWLATNMTWTISGSRLLILFLLSGLMRLATNILFIRSFSEVKKVEKIETHEMFYIILGFSAASNLGDEVFYRNKNR